MSSDPRTVVGASMYGVGVAPKVGYTNGSDSATPLCHVGIFSRLSPLSADFSSYTMRHATEGMDRMVQGPLS